MFEFPPPPILEIFCPLFMHIAQMGSHLPRWGLILLRIKPLTPVLYSAVNHFFLGYVHAQNTPNPTPKQPFSWPELESGQNELPSVQPRPQLGKMFEKWTKLFYKWAFLSIHICYNLYDYLPTKPLSVCLLIGAAKVSAACACFQLQ